MYKHCRCCPRNIHHFYDRIFFFIFYDKLYVCDIFSCSLKISFCERVGSVLCIKTFCNVKFHPRQKKVKISKYQQLSTCLSKKACEKRINSCPYSIKTEMASRIEPWTIHQIRINSLWDGGGGDPALLARTSKPNLTKNQTVQIQSNQTDQITKEKKRPGRICVCVYPRHLSGLL